jgi:hypothetical protein
MPKVELKSSKIMYSGREKPKSFKVCSEIIQYEHMRIIDKYIGEVFSVEFEL